MTQIKSLFLVFLVGLVSVCRAAPSAPATPPLQDISAPLPTGATASISATQDDLDAFYDEDAPDSDEANDYAADDYEEEYDDPEDEDMDETQESPEEQLSELAEEHFIVKMECADLKQMIQQATTANATAPTDPELQQAYNDCKQYLASLEQQIRDETNSIFAAGDEQSS